jgi:hypothetical protein
MGRRSAESSFVPRGITIGGCLTAKTSTDRVASFADASPLILLRFLRSLFLLCRHDRDFLFSFAVMTGTFFASLLLFCPLLITYLLLWTSFAQI